MRARIEIFIIQWISRFDILPEENHSESGVEEDKEEVNSYVKSIIVSDKYYWYFYIHIKTDNLWHWRSFDRLIYTHVVCGIT